MALQRINCNNGSLVGEYETIISKGETDCDTVPGVTLRFRHSFELYEGSPISLAARGASLILVVEFHDESNGSYRVGMEFPDIASMTKFVREFNPCDRLPPVCSTPEVVAQVRERYERRTQRFFQLVAERAEPVPLKPPANPPG